MWAAGRRGHILKPLGDYAHTFEMLFIELLDIFRGSLNDPGGRLTLLCHEPPETRTQGHTYDFGGFPRVV